LTAFSVAIIAGLFAGNPADTILLRSLVAMVGGQVLGLIVGMICERVVTDAVGAYEKSHPIGGPPSATASAKGPASLSP
jgi:hypothetical protein